MGRLLSRLSALGRDHSANVAIITALSALPLIGMMGLAIDYALAVSTKSQLDEAADAAAIAAITKAQTVINNSGTTTDGIAQGQAQGQAAFRANAGRLAFATAAPVPVVTVTRTGQSLSAAVTYATTTPNQFGKLFGVSYSAVSGKAVSAAALTTYYQFIFLVDVSNSMSIGGTAADITGLTNDPKIGCAFACHDPFHYQSTTDRRVVAKADGWTLKIDYVNQAVQNFVNDLQTQTAGLQSSFAVGIDTFGTNFTVLQAPTTNFTLSKAAAATIDIESAQPSGANYGYTQTRSALLSTLSNLSNIGDGSSATKQITYVILLSDAAEDVPGNSAWGRIVDLSYTSACSSLKAAGATLISIVAPYPVVNDPQYTALVAPLSSQLSPTMSTCASSSSWFYQANDGPGINTAVQSALAGILQGLTRLTQ